MPARLVRDAHGRVGRVDRLPARPGGAVDVDLQVVRVDLHVDVLGLGQHRDGRRRGVDAALGLGLRHALHAVRAALELEHRVGAVALDRERVLAVADVHRLGLPAAALGVLGEHPVEVARPQARLVAAGAALDFDDHALLVVGVALDHRHADLLLELLDPLARAASARRASRRPRPPRRAAPRRRRPCPAPRATAPRASPPARAGGRRDRPRRSARGRRSPRGRSSARRARRSASRSA